MNILIFNHRLLIVIVGASPLMLVMYVFLSLLINLLIDAFLGVQKFLTHFLALARQIFDPGAAVFWFVSRMSVGILEPLASRAL